MWEQELKYCEILLQLNVVLDYYEKGEKGSSHSSDRHLHWFLSNLMLLEISCQ